MRLDGEDQPVVVDVGGGGGSDLAGDDPAVRSSRSRRPATGARSMSRRTNSATDGNRSGAIRTVRWTSSYPASTRRTRSSPASARGSRGSHEAHRLGRVPGERLGQRGVPPDEREVTPHARRQATTRPRDPTRLSNRRRPVAKNCRPCWQNTRRTRRRAGDRHRARLLPVDRWVDRRCPLSSHGEHLWERVEPGDRPLLTDPGCHQARDDARAHATSSTRSPGCGSAGATSSRAHGWKSSGTSSRS